MKDRYDVVVIGGGPAGSAAAGFLAKKGLSVALLEKAKHPRYQVGESLISHFWRFCDALGVTPAIEAEGFIAKSGGTMYWDGELRQFTFAEYGHPRPGLHVERDRFDEILFRHAATLGADVHEEVAVSSADTADGDCTVRARFPGDDAEAEIKCRWVVDATGQAGLLAKRHKLRQMDDSFRYLAMWGYFQGSKYVSFGGTVHDAADARTAPPSTFVAALDHGWGWNIILRDTTSVGILVERDRLAQEEKKDLTRFFLDTCRGTPYFADLLADATFEEGSLRMHRDYSYRCTAASGPGFFLVGDAAAFTDPIFSHGVQFALYSGFVAANEVERCLRGKPEHARKNYDFWARQYYEFSRSLALPNYDPTTEIHDSVKTMLRGMPKDEIELLYVASSMTSRSSNFWKIAHAAGMDAEPRGLRILPELKRTDGTTFVPRAAR